MTRRALAVLVIALGGCLEVPPSRLGNDGGAGDDASADGASGDGAPVDGAVQCPPSEACTTALDLTFDNVCDLAGWDTSFAAGCSISVDAENDVLRLSQTAAAALCIVRRTDGVTLTNRSASAKLRNADGNLAVGFGLVFPDGRRVGIGRDNGSLHLGACDVNGNCIPDEYGSAAVVAVGALWLRLAHDSASQSIAFLQSADGVTFTPIVTAKATGVIDADVECAALEVSVGDDSEIGSAVIDAITVGP